MYPSKFQQGIDLRSGCITEPAHLAICVNIARLIANTVRPRLCFARMLVHTATQQAIQSQNKLIVDCTAKSHKVSSGKTYFVCTYVN